MLYSIIKAKWKQETKAAYFSEFLRREQHEDLVRLAENGWYYLEPRVISNRDHDLEEALEDVEIGSQEEEDLLRRYFKLQKTPK